MANDSIARSEPPDPAVTYSFHLADGAGILPPGRVTVVVPGKKAAIDVAFAALWDSDRRDIAAQVDAHVEGYAPDLVCFAVKSEEDGGIRYQTPDQAWHFRMMHDTPEQAARKPVVAVFDSTHVYPQHVAVVDLSSSRSLSQVGTVDALDVSYRDVLRGMPESVVLYLNQLRTLPLELLASHLNKIKGTGRIIRPLKSAIDDIVAQANAFGPARVSEPTLFIDRSSSDRGGLEITPFGGAIVQDFTGLLAVHTTQDRQSVREKYGRLPISIREQIEIFGRHHGTAGDKTISLRTLPYIALSDGGQIPVLNRIGDGPTDTGAGKYALVTTAPRPLPGGGPWHSKTYRYLVRMPDNVESPNGYIPEFPQDFSRPTMVETFRVPAGRALSKTVARDTPAWNNRTLWAPAPEVGPNGKAAHVFVRQQVASLG